jgi:signal transduction histidine kinase
MQRMIEQMMDLIEDRLSAGITIIRDREHDLVPIVLRIVDDLRQSHPGRSIELVSDAACVAAVDADRVEQVVSTLVGNAVVHGDSTRPVQVSIVACARQTRIIVHNHGPAIEPAQLGRTFAPLSRVPESGARPEGLGLGLYIAQRILRAHSGTLEVESSESGGTRFEAVFPSVS